MNFFASILSPLFYSPYLTAILVITVFALSKYYASKKRSRSYWVDKNITPAKSSSFILNFLKKTRVEDAALESVRKYGKIYGVTQFGGPTIVCTDPELISLVLSKEFTSFPNRRSFKINEPISGNMLSLLEDEQWKRIRSIVSPAFSSGRLRKMRPLINDCIQTLLKNLENLSNESNEVEMKRVFGAFTMEVVIQVAFGTKVDALIDVDNPIIINAKKILSKDLTFFQILKFVLLVFSPKLANLLNISFIDIEVIDFFKEFTLKIIDERKRNKSSVKRYDFLQSLLDAIDNKEENIEEEIENQNVKLTEHEKILFVEQKVVTHNKTMSDIEMISQCVLFFFAGYETTATTLSFASYLIAEHPEVQQKLYEESKTVLESKKDIDYEAIDKLEYLNAVVSESLRIFPPAVFLERRAADDIVLGSQQIKVDKGDIINIPIYALHRDPEHFEDPESFKPERFLPQNISHHPYSYLPFGAGPRNCVARRLALMEAKLALLHTVYNFKFTFTENTDKPPQCYNNTGLLIPKRILLKVEKRRSE